MKRSAFPSSAMTRLELVVVLTIATILVSLAVPAFTSNMCSLGPFTRTLNNARQLLLASSQMANDGVSTGDANLGWPGDLASKSIKPVTTASSYVQTLMKNGYLKPNDVIKITAAPGIPFWDGHGEFDDATHLAFKVYRVTKVDGDSAIFAATRNFTYGSRLSATQAPFQEKAFVVVQKGGSALILPQKEAKSFQLIGLLPGRQNVNDRPIEQSYDILIQK
jgi:type II secretory pathway pseudopilin PulG